MGVVCCCGRWRGADAYPKAPGAVFHHRDAELLEHSVKSLIKQRMYGRLRRGPRYVRQDIQVTLAPSVSRRVIPSAATVLRSGTPRRYRSRVPSLNDSTPSI